MTKRIVQTPEEAELYRDLRRLVKRANQRLLRAERLTGEKGTFASKQLYDYLGASNLDAVSDKGRIRLKKSYNTNQMRAIKKATEQYLKSSTSTQKGIKRFTKEESERAGSDLSYKEADTMYQARHNWTWILKYMTESEFFTLVKVAKEEGWSQEKWIEELEQYIDDVTDEDLKFRLQELYNYFVRE